MILLLIPDAGPDFLSPRSRNNLDLLLTRTQQTEGRNSQPWLRYTWTQAIAEHSGCDSHWKCTLVRKEVSLDWKSLFCWRWTTGNPGSKGVCLLIPAFRAASRKAEVRNQKSETRGMQGDARPPCSPFVSGGRTRAPLHSLRLRRGHTPHLRRRWCPSCIHGARAETVQRLPNFTKIEPPTPIFVGPAGGGGGDTQMYIEREWRVYP